MPVPARKLKIIMKLVSAGQLGISKNQILRTVQNIQSNAIIQHLHTIARKRILYPNRLLPRRWTHTQDNKNYLHSKQKKIFRFLRTLEKANHIVLPFNAMRLLRKKKKSHRASGQEQRHDKTVSTTVAIVIVLVLLKRNAQLGNNVSLTENMFRLPSQNVNNFLHGRND